MDISSYPRGFFAVACLGFMGLLAGCGGGGGDGDSPPPAGGPEFRHEGLAGLTVLRIYQSGDRLIAASDDGVFGKVIGESAWQPIGLQGHQVQDLAILADQHMLATAVFEPDPIVFQDPRLYETVNGGANWLPVDNDFGGGFSENIGMWALHYDAADGRLYATGQDALAVSEDIGRSWQLLSGWWDGFSPGNDALALSLGTGDVWYGGQNALEQMVLRRYDPGNDETTNFDGFLLPPPATIKGITVDPTRPGRILASGEGGILQTFNNGQSWERPLGDVNFRFYFQTALDPADSRIIYTAGWTKEFERPQPLVIEVSTDLGASWSAYTLDDPDLFGGAWSLQAVTEGGRTVLYVGLFRGGIMKVVLPTRPLP